MFKILGFQEVPFQEVSTILNQACSRSVINLPAFYSPLNIPGGWKFRRKRCIETFLKKRGEFMSVYWRILVHLFQRRSTHFVYLHLWNCFNMFQQNTPLLGLTTPSPLKGTPAGGAPKNPGCGRKGRSPQVVLWVTLSRSIRVSHAWPCIAMDYTALAAPSFWRAWWRMHVTLVRRWREFLGVEKLRWRFLNV